jgi:hypothetical protein
MPNRILPKIAAASRLVGDDLDAGLEAAEAWRRKTLGTLLVGIIASRAKALGLRYLVGDSNELERLTPWLG